MIKIKSIKFKTHPILGNLHLDFCDKNGNPADTIIIAGENGTGKTTVLEEIYKIMNYECDSKGLDLEVICDGKMHNISYFEDRQMYFANQDGSVASCYYNFSCDRRMMQRTDEKFKDTVRFRSIYSTVNINFETRTIHKITNQQLDKKNISNIRFESNTANEIIQLLIDIRSNDAEIILQAIEKNQDTKNIERKFNRFKKAFNTMFYDKLSFKGISNNGNEKNIIFSKDNKEVSINDLSSGEKQIVFRGAFLLQNKDALNGAVVLIDEPEISMHPEWQKKIMDFYKKIFQNKKGEQTSQIIVTTHSPFIIHNENRYNDKVIVLKYNKIGGVVSSGYPEYYQANTVQAVEDAFNIQNFLSNTNENIVFVEGKTDEQYFNKAVEVFNIKNLPFVFKWIGHIGKNNQEEFTGDKSLNQAYSFWKGHNNSCKKVFLYDFDRNKQDEEKNNCYIRSITKQGNSKGVKAGIENALVLDDIENFKDFFNNKTEKGNYGEEKIIPEFKKQEFCNYICNLDNEQLKIILSNLKTEIEKLRTIFEQ